MDKVCEYCKVLRPVVYCKADAAKLCLPCDAKIHSANALSNRHSRTLMCESCRCHRAYIQCSNHQMFMCRNCDRSQHNISSQHQRRVISSYIGCPSAKDLAALWGFHLNDLDDSTSQDQFVFASCMSVDTGAVNCDTLMQSCRPVGGSSLVSEVDSVTSHSGAECEVGFSSKHTKLWSQNMQDLGVCEELGCLDELSMPDIDLTFRNFEELFGGEQEPTRALLNDRSMTCASVEKDISFDRLEHGYARRMEVSAQSEANEIARTSYKENKKVRRNEKKVQYASRKARDDAQKRVRGRFVNAEGHDSDTVDAARSY